MPTPLRLLSFLLLPFAWLYGGVVRLRNYLYDRHIFPAFQAPIPVICVGNLTVGGTGKTPQVEYLARLLQPRKIAILSRGYKRKTKGFVLAMDQATAHSIGDEPYQYTLNLPDVIVAVCEKRALGIQRLLQLYPDLEVVLLDDAYQHRAVKASTYLLLTDFGRLFTQDFLLPMGRLREPKAGARRADAVVVTKCPESLTAAQQGTIQKRISKYTSAHTPVFFSKIVYGAAVPIGEEDTLAKQLILVTGIANAKPLVQHLESSGHIIVQHFQEPDHAAYSAEKVGEVLGAWESFSPADVSILMTQKDAVKWQSTELKQHWRQAPVFYAPITVSFGAETTAFDQLLQTWACKTGYQNNP